MKKEMFHTVTAILREVRKARQTRKGDRFACAMISGMKPVTGDGRQRRR